MSDLIKREDAIKAFVEETNGVNVEEAIKVVDAYLRIRECDEVWDSIRAIRDCLECAKDEIAEFIPSANRPQGEWIPCSERLPESQGYYICTCKDGSKYKRTTVIKWSNGWQLTGSRTYWVVVAWMPLPEPYGEREGE